MTRLRHVKTGTATDQLHQQRLRFASRTRSLRRKLGGLKIKLIRSSLASSDSLQSEPLVYKPRVAGSNKTEISFHGGESSNHQRTLSSNGLTKLKNSSIADSKDSYTPSWDECKINGSGSGSSESVISGVDKLAEAVPQLPIFRKWPDDELELQREVIEKYEAGVRLWTKESLLNMEEMITGLGGVVRTSLYGRPGTYVCNKEIGHLYKVNFHGYQDMAFPFASRPEGIAYSSMTISEKPAYTYIRKDLDEQEARFAQCQIPLPPYINKIVCIGLGNFIAPEIDEDNPGLALSMLRHAAVVTVAKTLFKRFGRQIQIFAQDVNYTPDCAAVLFRKGFSIVGRYGAGGLAEIDDKTFVFAPPSDLCVKEIVADIAKPAAMFWGTVMTPEENDIASRSHRLVAFGDYITSSWKYVPPATQLAILYSTCQIIAEGI
ncbi:hypothetical protein F4814DRAFT_445846 [Daldinia grandis]|nr:hypothetical protein F4814DRAFT_445846 [Daldinia grandis]